MEIKLLINLFAARNRCLSAIESRKFSEGARKNEIFCRDNLSVDIIQRQGQLLFEMRRFWFCDIIFIPAENLIIFWIFLTETL